jgi:hypothetical protein
MRATNDIQDLGARGGFALVLTMLVVVVMVALVTSAVMVGANHRLADRYYERGSLLEAVANSGLELVRAQLNGEPGLYPDEGYVTLENGAEVKDGGGNVIPGVKRWLYVGPTGVTSGQYGMYGSIVAVVRDAGGGEVVRRSQIYQQSFARFAYYTDSEGDNIWFWDDIFYGPVHSNDQLKMWGDMNHFYAEVTTAKDVKNPDRATFHEGITENAAVIPMPKTADLNNVRSQAEAGGTSFNGDTGGDENEATTRIEFVAIDLNGDGDTTDDDEGFFKVYQSSDAEWLSGSYDDDLRDNDNCGRLYGNTFVSAPDHPYNGVSKDNAVKNANSVCYLGGDERITNGFVASDDYGSWIPWTGTVAPGLAGRPDANYLFPLSRRYNPDFKGVVAVKGNVGVSGVVRGSVTVVATGSIRILDDLTYATDPGAGTCQDMTGLFAGQDVIVSHNLRNAAQRPYPGINHRTYDDTKDEFIHAVILALENFGAGEPGLGSTDDEDCEGNQGGRGCLYSTGGIIQQERGPVGKGDYGYWKRYSWDACAMDNPPPYFPTTGHFSKGQAYDVDPAGFSVAAYYASLTPTG